MTSVTPEPRTASLPALRPYQEEALRAILRSVREERGLSFSVEIARQGGKNELSARLELLLLLLNADRPRTAVKAAPTLKPQALISMERLWASIEGAGLISLAKREGGNAVRIGRARQLFLSAEPYSNIVGHTADLLLEVDEAQDVDIEKFDKELRPMAASTGATTVFYGTAWDDSNLLERSKQAHLEAERRDGVRRHFEFDWETVARYRPPYARFVADERERLGAEHPIFLSQYCLRTLPGSGRLFGPRQLSLLHGSHARLAAPVPGESYVAALDVAGESQEGTSAGHDSTVLSIARVSFGETTAPWPQIEVVAHYAWTGEPLAEVQDALLSLLKHTWRAGRVAVDATGIGEPVAAFLRRTLGERRVQAVKLSAEAKSGLGYDLLAATNSGCLRLYEPGGAAAAAECWRQLERCRASYRPNQTMAFAVDPREGHDDYVISLALTVAAAKSGAPRRARGRERGEALQPAGGAEWLP